ncbi:plasmid segregation centromere-binding protein ParG [Nitrosomonas eutropha]|nr:plasmid segregation centromere-binding protein ParG [Nitrosomonas eutropha]
MSSGKKVQIGMRPTANKPTSTNADDWVTSRGEKSDTPTIVVTEKMKRLTIDIAEDLHRNIKRECATQGINIADVVRELLNEWVQKQVKS